MTHSYVYYTNNFGDYLEILSQKGVIKSNFEIKFYTRTKFALDKNFRTQSASDGPRDTKAHYCCIRKPSTDIKRCSC